MRNPLRNETEAFRFVLLAIGYFALIVAAAAINRWLGLVVFAALTAAAAVAVWRSRGEPPPRRAVGRNGDDHVRRILVIANETVGGIALHQLLRERASSARIDVLVVCPALNSRLRHWASDEDGARRDAEDRLDASLAALEASGISASGEVGDADPLQAIDDALRIFGADEVVISTHPPGTSHWLERGVVNEALRRYDVPITHVVAGTDDAAATLLASDG